MKTLLAAFALPHAWAQTTCLGTTIAGTVHDSTRAVIPGATLTLDGGQDQTSGADGAFAFLCVAGGSHHLTAAAAGFAQRAVTLTAPHAGGVDLMLQPEAVETRMDVNGDDDGAPGTATSGPGSRQNLLHQ
jgi:Carboxypeptidase regulatory-like domain